MLVVVVVVVVEVVLLLSQTTELEFVHVSSFQWSGVSGYLSLDDNDNDNANDRHLPAHRDLYAVLRTPVVVGL